MLLATVWAVTIATKHVLDIPPSRVAENGKQKMGSQECINNHQIHQYRDRLIVYPLVTLYIYQWLYLVIYNTTCRNLFVFHESGSNWRYSISLVRIGGRLKRLRNFWKPWRHCTSAQVYIKMVLEAVTSQHSEPLPTQGREIIYAIIYVIIYVIPFTGAVY